MIAELVPTHVPAIPPVSYWQDVVQHVFLPPVGQKPVKSKLMPRFFAETKMSLIELWLI